jgi:hypothetical protein
MTTEPEPQVIPEPAPEPESEPAHGGAEGDTPQENDGA